MDFVDLTDGAPTKVSADCLLAVAPRSQLQITVTACQLSKLPPDSLYATPEDDPDGLKFPHSIMLLSGYIFNPQLGLLSCDTSKYLSCDTGDEAITIMIPYRNLHQRHGGFFRLLRSDFS